MGHPSLSISSQTRHDLRNRFIVVGPTIVPQPIRQTGPSDLQSTDSQKVNLVSLEPRLWIPL